MNIIKILVKGWVKGLPIYLLTLLPLFVSCSDEVDEETDEYANWQTRNEAYIADIAAKYPRLKSFTKDQNAEGAVSDYIYYEVLEHNEALEQGDVTECPFYSDTVRISYRGRLMPTTSYPDGYVFDQTFKDEFSWQTTGVNTYPAAGFVDGFTTALQHMHRGDRWRIYIPYQLGYKKAGKSSAGVPGYSTLVFDIALIDFSHPGYSMPRWSSREMRD